MLLCTNAYAENVYVAKYDGDRQAAISYTFDDGLLEHYTMVFPKLKELGIKATFCIIGSKVGRDQKGTPCMTWEQLKEMADAGYEITNHGFKHQSMEKISGEALRYEVQHNDTLIYNNVGVFPRTYFYPGNRKTEEGLAFCSKERVGTRTFQVSMGGRRDSIWTEKWLERTLIQKEWGVTMTHGITIGYDCMKDPKFFWDHLKKVSNMQDRIWIATFHDISAYIAERDAIILDIKAKKNGYIVKPVLSLDKSIFHQPLTLVVKGKIAGVKQKGKNLSVTYKEGNSLFNFDPHGGTIHIMYDN